MIVEYAILILLMKRARRRRPGFDRLNIYSSRDHPFSSQGEGEGGRDASPSVSP